MSETFVRSEKLLKVNFGWECKRDIKWNLIKFQNNYNYHEIRDGYVYSKFSSHKELQ